MEHKTDIEIFRFCHLHPLALQVTVTKPAFNRYLQRR